MDCYSYTRLYILKTVDIIHNSGLRVATEILEAAQFQAFYLSLEYHLFIFVESNYPQITKRDHIYSREFKISIFNIYFLLIPISKNHLV